MPTTYSPAIPNFPTPAAQYDRENEDQFRRLIERALLDIATYNEQLNADPLSVATHVLATTAGLGPQHSVSGLTARQFLVASSPTSALFRAIQTADVPAAALTRVDDTNVTLTLGGSPSSALLAATSLTLGWSGTLAAARLNANVVQAITNDTNVTGSIATQTLTLGWSGVLGLARGGVAANLSATGPGYLKQASGGAAVTVAFPPFSEITGNLAYGQLPSGSGTWTGTPSVSGLLTAQAGLTVSGGVGIIGTDPAALTSEVLRVGGDVRFGVASINQLHLGGLTVLANNGGAGAEYDLAANAYYSSGWRYYSAQPAAALQIDDGATGLTYSTASAGAAPGDPVTWTTRAYITRAGLARFTGGLEITGGSIAASGIAATLGSLGAGVGPQTGKRASVSADHATTDHFYLTDSNASPYAFWSVGISTGGSFDGIGFYAAGAYNALRLKILAAGGADFVGGAVSMGALTATTGLFAAAGNGQVIIQGNAATNQAELQFKAGATARWSIYAPGSSTDLRFFDQASGTDKAILTAAAFSPATSGGLTLGTASLPWGVAYLGSQTKLNGILYTWPGADGTGGYVLSTNGSGTLSWVAQTGGGGLTGGGSAYYYAVWTAGTALGTTPGATAKLLSGSTDFQLRDNADSASLLVISNTGFITTGVWHGSSVGTTYTDAKVVSVAGRNGVVVLTADDIGAGTFPGAVGFGGTVTFASEHTYSYSATATNSLDATGYNLIHVSLTVAGIQHAYAGCNGVVNGRVIFFLVHDNGLGGTLRFLHESGSEALEVRRFHMASGTNLDLVEGGGAVAIYDSYIARWRVAKLTF